jgi:hypothetical protein
MIKSKDYMRFGVLTVVNIHVVLFWIQQRVAWQMVTAVSEDLASSICRVDGGIMFFRNLADHLNV